MTSLEQQSIIDDSGSSSRAAEPKPSTRNEEILRRRGNSESGTKEIEFAETRKALIKNVRDIIAELKRDGQSEADRMKVVNSLEQEAERSSSMTIELWFVPEYNSSLQEKLTGVLERSIEQIRVPQEQLRVDGLPHKEVMHEVAKRLEEALNEYISYVFERSWKRGKQGVADSFARV